MAQRATYVGPLAALIGREGDTLMQRAAGRVDWASMQRAIREEQGVENEDVFRTLPEVYVAEAGWQEWLRQREAREADEQRRREREARR